MALRQYGVLKGTVAGHLRDADDDHYQILVQAGGVSYRIAVNVKSQAKNAPSTLLFQAVTALPAEMREKMRALKPGYRRLSKGDGLAQDYVRGGLVRPAGMTEVPPDEPGDDNDLKDKVEAAALKAAGAEGAVVYAFGERWGPEKTKRDQYFHFLPGNGIHDIHMNQGNADQWKRDNGTFQDGALVFEYPGDRWQAFFFAFQSQTFHTDGEGNADGESLALGDGKVGGGGGRGGGAKGKGGRKKKKRRRAPV